MVKLILAGVVAGIIVAGALFGLMLAAMDGGQICLTPLGIVADWM